MSFFYTGLRIQLVHSPSLMEFWGQYDQRVGYRVEHTDEQDLITYEYTRLYSAALRYHVDVALTARC